MSKGQNRILDSLMKENLDVNGLIEVTQLSDSFVRNSLKYLESTGQVEKVDKRVPYMYRIPPDNPLIRNQRIVEEYKQDLMDKNRETDTLGRFVQGIPKEHWLTMADNFELMSAAIKKLEAEGLLFETLEDTA